MLWRWMLELQFWMWRNVPGYMMTSRPGHILIAILIGSALGFLIATLLSLGEILRWRAGF